MRVKYDKSCDELTVSTLNGEYRISTVHTGEYVLEEIELPYRHLYYVGSYQSVGTILDELLLDEIDVIKNEGV